MNDQFIPYEQALQLKELQFDEECICHYNQSCLLKGKIIGSPKGDYLKKDKHDDSLPAPLWQQAFDWFEDKYGLFSEQDNILLEYCISSRQDGHVTIVKGYDLLGRHSDRQEVREARLNHLIKIVHERTTTTA